MGGWYLGFVGLIFIVVPLWRICARAGFSPALSLLAFIPFLGLVIVAAMLAFAEWPRLKNKQPD